MNDRPAPTNHEETERIRRLYDERAATYDRSLGFSERLMLGPLRHQFGALLEGKTLEVAIGSGLNLPYYSSAVTRATGVDLSEEMLRQARQKADSAPFPVTLLQADAASLPFPDHAFDTVAISLALCTIPNPAAALREMARVCRPDGRIILLEHVRSPAWPLGHLQQLLSPLNERAIGCHLARETFDLATALGFSLEASWSRLFGAVRLAVVRPPTVEDATLAEAVAAREERAE